MDESKKIGIKIEVPGQPTIESARKAKAQANFISLIKGAGTTDIGLDSLDAGSQYQFKKYLPKGFSPEHLTSALFLHAQGVKSQAIETKIDEEILKKPDLTDDQKASLYALPYTVAIFEKTNWIQNPALQSDIEQMYQDQIISPLPYQPPPPTQSINFVQS